jgi:3-hydroxyacyl-CoA dehydrogenase/enoyl-CoA hydratase/3-hydroxybutyryl-CoA epimerase
MGTEQDFRVAFEASTGVATVWMQMVGGVNKINGRFGAGLGAALDEARGTEGLTGIVLASAHRDFCVGADLDVIFGTTGVDALYTLVQTLHQQLRALETVGVPVVAALTGTALGGGYELALACHHRIALDDARLQVGLPETQLGVIPGGGGTQRLPRLIGLQPALEILAQGKSLRAPKALKAGLVDALAPDAEAVHAQATTWILAHPKAQQPWDRRGFTWPGIQPDTEAARMLFAGASALLVKKTAGAYRAPEAAVQAVYEGALLRFDAALTVEARYFVERVVSDQAKDMLRTLWFHRNAVARQEGQPHAEADGFTTVGIIGAGMMGAGLACMCAERGYAVVLKDVSQPALDRGLAHCAAWASKRAKRTGASAEDLLALITPTLNVPDLAGCDLVIEAVFEDLALKHRVIRETEAVLPEHAIFASNTSALPIASLAAVSLRPAQFIGLHYFSPVDRMPLLEVIAGPSTSEATLARCLAFARSTRKTALVVNDGYGFYTTRVFSAYIAEAAELVAEGHDPAVLEWAARQAGMVVAPLKVFDEVTLSLGVKALGQRGASPGLTLLQAMVAEGRLGKAAGAGFYDYSTRPRRLWSGLAALVAASPKPADVPALAGRLMLAQALEAARCLDEGILNSARDGDVGAVLGVGFAPCTGGPFAWLDRQTAAGAVAQADALVAAGLKRFEPPALLRQMAAEGTRFYTD